MVILTLVSTIAAGMVWQQWRAVQVEEAERMRVQAGWILTGALDLGRVILRIDGRTPGPDHLGEPWATQLQEASLSSLLSQDRNNNVDGGPEVYLLGGIRDAQSRYNLRNLIDGNQRIVPEELAALTRLCEAAGAAPEAAQTIANGLQAAWQQGNDAAGESAAQAPLAPKHVGQLVWLGVDAETVEKLRPYVDLLPDATPLNINTAEPKVLAGVIAGLDASSAQRLAQSRQSKYFETLDDIRAYIPGEAQLDAKRLSVSSNYFEVYGRLRAQGRALEERMLVVRNRRDVTPLWRERRSVVPGDS